MKKYRKQAAAALCAAAIAALLLSGCGNGQTEEELAYRQVGINSMQEGDYESAVAAFETALSLCGGGITDMEIDICYYKAAALYALGNLQEAYDVYTSLIDYDGKNADAYYLRGCLALQLGDSEQAKSDYAAAVKVNDTDYELYINIYRNLSGYGLTEDGEDYLEQAFDIKGNDAEHLAWRGQLYYLLGQYENATTELLAAIEKGSVSANLTLAQVYEATGDTQSAEIYYQTYVQSGEADSEALNALAEIELAKGNYAEALSYAREGLAMENVSNRRALLQNEMIASEYLGDFAGAWEIMQEYIAAYPDDLDAQREYTFLKYRQTDAEEDITEEDTENNTEDATEDTTESTTEPLTNEAAT